MATEMRSQLSGVAFHEDDQAKEIRQSICSKIFKDTLSGIEDVIVDFLLNRQHELQERSKPAGEGCATRMVFVPVLCRQMGLKVAQCKKFTEDELGFLVKEAIGQMYKEYRVCTSVTSDEEQIEHVAIHTPKA
ncbi:unnamed protein product [Amoebophrya sp. A25]|nr:unnamed protein product [Amoebophrya sp. A25]|eukprot:GSA25T00020014001.1